MKEENFGHTMINFMNYVAAINGRVPYRSNVESLSL